MLTWVMIAYFKLGYSGGPMKIENIRTQQECLALANSINKDFKLDLVTARCYPVMRAK